VPRLAIGYNGAPHIRPQNFPLPWIDPQTLDPSDLPPQTASTSDQLFCHNALERQTNRWLEGMFDDYRPISVYRERQHGPIIIVINVFVQHHEVITSDVLGPGSVLVISKSIPMRESLRESLDSSLVYRTRLQSYCQTLSLAVSSDSRCCAVESTY